MIIEGFDEHGRVIPFVDEVAMAHDERFLKELEEAKAAEEKRLSEAKEK